MLRSTEWLELALMIARLSVSKTTNAKLLNSGSLEVAFSLAQIMVYQTLVQNCQRNSVANNSSRKISVVTVR